VISTVATCLLVWHPLASTGNENGMWFVGDQDPTVLNIDARTKGLDYSICVRVSRDSYVILQRLDHRPIDLAVYEDALWFVDYASNMTLYSIQNASQGTPRTIAKTTLQGVLSVESTPTDLISFPEGVAVGCGGETLQVHTYDGYDWKQIPTLDVPNARIAYHNGALIAATPHEQGAMLWSHSDDGWAEGILVELNGAFYDVLTKKDWLLLVSTENERSHIVGLQGTDPIEIASFDVPKGSWSVVSSPEGLSVVGVQRNGTTTVLDIGWASGKTHAMLELRQESSSGLSFIDRFPFLVPATLVLLLFLLMSRRSKTKIAKK